jgi:DHA1 family multidrug resistance protein-like MFS transporter
MRKNQKFVVFLTVFTAFLGFTIIIPVLAPLIREVGLSEFQAGLIISFAALMLPLTSPFWGKRSDRQGRKPVLLLGLFGLCIGFVLFTLFAWMGMEQMAGGMMLFVLLALSRMVMGLFMAAVPPTAQAYMADLTSKEERSAGMAVIGAANALGLIIGPAVAGLLITFGLLIPLYLAILLPVVAFLLVWRLLPVMKADQAADRGNDPKISVLQPQLWPFLLIGCMSMILIVALQINLGFYLQDRFALDTLQTGQYVGLALTVVGVMLIITQGAQARLLKWPVSRMLKVGFLLGTAGFLGMLLAPDFLQVLGALMVMGAGFGLVIPGFMAGASLAVSETQQGAVAGLTGAAQGIGAVVGPLFGTILYQLDMRYPLVISCALLLLLTVFVFANKVLRSAKQVQPTGASDR